MAAIKIIYNEKKERLYNLFPDDMAHLIDAVCYTIQERQLSAMKRYAEISKLQLDVYNLKESAKLLKRVKR